ncbi:hypothetical protein MYCTH_2121696 [Thermothelomyces thermophilus ATCC 42464]|uniref:Protein kinase domain-containing protein n=1 Tax=Thermothelomyces thermophilus (strain ATCC 42464 / BCRC 31852 / DSM 1799) TaxID=573729 RepID=G2QN62_THET4|nr:uncharacterized protein MYCTH_2121696 [Thermothelomyces thermophilus ATCC 42464]AEO61935.1 hypothetical protein MYCTH_2121696 [Thermothelomyces thermophilus ATCC 42464]
MTLIIHGVTISPVLNVVLFGTTELGTPFHFQAILKLYDHRFGEHLRMRHWKHVPHTAAREADFQSYVRQGKMGRFLHRKEEDSYDNDIEDADDGDGDCERSFKSETEAYERLKDLQGKLIPRMFAHVRLVMPFPDTPRDLLESPETARFLEVKGVIVDFIRGYPLSQRHTDHRAPQNVEDWQDIVQAAVDAVHEIDSRGVLNRDCSPRNMVVDFRTQTPFIIDFANHDDSEIEYWEEVVTTNNEGAIGAVMTQKLRRLKGLELAIQYANSEKILEEMKRRKGVKSSKDRTDSSGWKILHF